MDDWIVIEDETADRSPECLRTVEVETGMRVLRCK